MKKLVLGVLLATVAQFLLGFLFWGLLPVVDSTIESDFDQVAVGALLSENLKGSGVYLLPYDAAMSEDMLQRHKAGPVAMIHFRREGVDAMQASIMIYGFLHMLVSCALLAVVMKMVARGLPTYGSRAGFAVMLGVAAGVFGNLGNPIWWHQSWTWHGVQGLYEILGMALAGVILAAFVKQDA